MFQYLKGSSKKRQRLPFYKETNRKDMGQWVQVPAGEIPFKRKDFFFTLRKINHCNNLSKDVVGFSKSEEEHKGVSAT